MMSRVQSDIKVSLAYASLTQVGIIVVEIGLGLRYLALIHIIGHACMRTMQLLRAPTLLRDYHEMENQMGERLPRDSRTLTKHLPNRFQEWCYRFGYDRAFTDVALDQWIVEPFLAVFRWFDRMEHVATDRLSHESSRESDTIELHPESSGRAA
jgi:NAD(P)H-quinone oxidoreductase subunit 5